MNKISVKKNIAKYIILVLTSFLVSYLPLQASIVSIKAPATVSTGERLAIDVLVDPQNQSINSIESTINFNPAFFDFNGFSLKQSSIPIWVEEPKEKQKGSIHFSGVIPGGIDRLYDPMNNENTSIPIVRLFFISKKTGSAEFSVTNSLVLQNDGMGTATKVSEKGLSLSIIPNKKGETSVLAEDTTVPEPFTVNIIERSVFGKTPRLAVFSAEDKEGGIERYEVAIGDLGFQRVTSPFPLPYKLFPYTLTARAYDYSGNFQEQKIEVGGEKPYGIGAILILIFLSLLAYRYYRKVKKV